MVWVSVMRGSILGIIREARGIPINFGICLSQLFVPIYRLPILSNRLMLFILEFVPWYFNPCEW